jgi:hypothetical protein
MAGVYAQTNSYPFVGEWVYSHNDTVFKIKLIVGTKTYQGEIIPEISNLSKTVFGGYSLTVNGVLVDNYINAIPTVFAIETSEPEHHIYISGVWSYPMIGFAFYDQRKLHNDGKGLGGGEMEYLPATDQIHWTLNEEVGLFWAYEADYNEGMERRPYPAPRGFSVPTNVIMNRVQPSSGSNNNNNNPPNDSGNGRPQQDTFRPEGPN